MYKKIRAYFKTEDDLESVHASLHKLNVKNIIVDQIPDDTELTGVYPIINNNSASGTASTTGGFTGVMLDEKSDVNNESDLTHILEFVVKDKEYEEALNIIKKDDGKVDKSTFE